LQVKKRSEAFLSTMSWNKGLVFIVCGGTGAAADMD